jgi:hypothetical protein
LTKITFKEWEEIVVHETIKSELDKLVEKRTQYLRSGQVAEPLTWAEGVVFSHNLLPLSEDVINQQVKGIIHYSNVEFAKMPKYRKNIVVSGGKSVPIVDVSNTSALRDLALELKKMLI